MQYYISKINFTIQIILLLIQYFYEHETQIAFPQIFHPVSLRCADNAGSCPARQRAGKAEADPPDHG
jgi:hypothetical protein